MGVSGRRGKRAKARARKVTGKDGTGTKRHPKEASKRRKQRVGDRNGRKKRRIARKLDLDGTSMLEESGSEMRNMTRDEVGHSH